MKDVNNFFAIGTNGKVKRKGLYASSGVLENKSPTMEVCSDAVAHWLAGDYEIEDYIRAQTDIRKFIEIRGVSGGGVQHPRTETVDDWVLVEDHDSAKNVWHSPRSDKYVKRKSRPRPYEVGVGGKPFGRVARWYMTTESLPPITYVKSGNKVPSTDGAKLCMTLPTKLPADLNLQWYIDEAHRILIDIGVE